MAAKAARLSELNAALDNNGKSGKERDQGNEVEPEDGEAPPRANPVVPAQEGDKPSIRAAIRSYTPPAPVSPGAEKSQRKETAL